MFSEHPQYRFESCPDYKKINMEVSMNGLRKRLITDYNSLTRKLNSAIQDKSWDPSISISPDYIREEMNSIRNSLVVLAFSYAPGNDGFEALDENTHFEEFSED